MPMPVKSLLAGARPGRCVRCGGDQHAAAEPPSLSLRRCGVVSLMTVFGWSAVRAGWYRPL